MAQNFGMNAAPYMQPNMQGNLFGGFKPDALQRIAGSLGYSGDMTGFDQYLQQNPDKQQRMDYYNQRAMQMAAGGYVKKMAVGGTLIQYCFHQRKATSRDIAHHPEVGLEGQLVGLKPLNQIDPAGRQLIAHRWVDIGITAGHAMAHGLGQLGQATHESPTNADDMNVHAALYRAGIILPCQI